DPVYGRPVGGKVQVTVIRHQGTPDEVIDPPLTVEVPSQDKPVSIKVKPIKLEGGRRTEAAYVAPSALQQAPEGSAAPTPLTRHDQILAQLRDLADPEGYSESKGFHGGFTSPGAAPAPEKPSPGRVPESVVYQTRVSSFMSNALDVTAQASLAADRRSVRLTV